MKKLLLGIVVSFSMTATAFADVTYVLRGAKPGAGVAAWNDAVAQTLNDNGVKTEILGFNDCVGAANWIKKNPEKPAISMVFSDLVLLNMIDPTNNAACDMPITNDTLVATAGKWTHFICGKEHNGTMEKLLSDEPKKIASWNSPVQMRVVKDQMDDLGVPNYSLVGYASGRVQLQSFVSGDVDYIILSSEQLIPTGAVCFGTSGDDTFAKLTKRTSYTEVNPDVRHVNSGLLPIILGFNLEMDKVRTWFAHDTEKNEQLNALTKHILPVTESIEEQVADLKQRAENLK